MGLLATCPKCRCMYMPGNPCPNCHYREGVQAEDAAAEAEEHLAEYARRRADHSVAYAAWMIRSVALGLLGLLVAFNMFMIMFRGSRYLSYFMRADDIDVGGSWRFGFLFFAMMGLAILGLAVAAIAQFVYLGKREAMEVHCPACDVRLDEIPMEGGLCPGCNVRLM